MRGSSVAAKQQVRICKRVTLGQTACPAARPRSFGPPLQTLRFPSFPMVSRPFSSFIGRTDSEMRRILALGRRSLEKQARSRQKCLRDRHHDKREMIVCGSAMAHIWRLRGDSGATQCGTPSKSQRTTWNSRSGIWRHNFSVEVACSTAKTTRIKLTRPSPGVVLCVRKYFDEVRTGHAPSALGHDHCKHAIVRKAAAGPRRPSSLIEIQGLVRIAGNPATQFDR